MKSLGRTLCFVSAAAWLTSAEAQQPDPLTDVAIQGYVYEPQPVPPTDERLAQLKRPNGFHITRFAEGLYNPRMLAVSADGTVYVTQRTPGNLVMIKDVDGDGVADTQKTILWMKNLHGIAIRGDRMFLVDVNVESTSTLQR
jgi:glucose/arabinose dehydrogenase